MTTRIALIDAARARIGGSRLQAETAPAAPAAILIYESVLTDLLSRHPWSFGKKKRRLNRLGAAAPPHWKHTYERPSDMVGVPRAIYDSGAESARPITAYELTEAGICASSSELWALYPIRPGPSVWPGFFTELFTKALMAEFAIPVREDRALRSDLLREVFGAPEMMGESGLFAQAKNMDGQGQPSAVLAGGANPLVDVRRSSAAGKWAGF
jgi:hypothetical protein